MTLVLIQRVYIYALWLIVTCGLLLVTVNSELVLVCPDGWHKHNTQCYWFSDFNATRDDAKIECEAQNSSLVTINTSNINNFLQQHICSNTNYWIGLKIDGISTYKWQWSSGQKVLSGHYRFINWCDGHTVGTACAAAVYSNIEPHICYESYNCRTEQRYVCEKEKLKMSSCPDGWDEHTIEDYSTCYYISVNRLSNMDAAMFCWSHKARLITVTHAGPNNYLRDKRPGPNEVYWIGLSPYKWDDATPYNWNNWDTDGPNIGWLCTLLQQDGTWHYEICSELHNIICQQDAAMTTATITATKSTPPTTSISTIKPKETTPETTFFTSSDRPSLSSVTTMSETSPPTSMYTTYSSTTPNGSSYMEMLSDKSTPASNSKLAMYLMIGVYSAVGVVSVVFVGLLATCLVLRKRHISRMKNMSMEQETPFAEVTTNDIDVDIEAIYNSPEIVQIDDAEHRQSSSSGDAANTDIVTKEQKNDNSGSKIQKENGQDTIVRTLSSSRNSTTSDDVITENSNSNTTQTRQTVTVEGTAILDAGMAHTSVSPGQVLINGEVYAEVDMSRKTIGYDDVVVLQTATNAHCKQSTSSEILSPICNQDANEQPDAEDTSENVYYNEPAQPIYSNEDSDHDLENEYNNAVPSDTCDTDNSINDEETYANCGDETGGMTYTEVDLPEPTSNMATTEEDRVVYSDIKM